MQQRLSRQKIFFFIIAKRNRCVCVSMYICVVWRGFCTQEVLGFNDILSCGRAASGKASGVFWNTPSTFQVERDANWNNNLFFS